MRWLRRLLNSGRRASTLERELADELAFHRAQQAADLEAEGWAPTEARREAHRRTGLTGSWVAAGLAEDTLPWLATWRRELRQALRGLARRPGLVVTACSTLALGGGVLLAAAAVVDRALVGPWPVPDVGRLVVLEESLHGESLGGNPSRTADWNRSLSSTEAVAGVYSEHLVLGRGADAERVLALRGVGPFTRVLGLRAARGRVFTPDEERDGAAVVMLTDRGWRRLMTGAPAAVDQQVTLRGERYQVVGVLPPSYDYPTQTDLVAPAGPAYQRAPRGGNWLQVVGRRRADVAVDRVQSEADAIARRFAEAYPDRERGLGVRVTPLRVFATREIRTPMLLLLAAASVVYLVVAVNVGGLLFVRALARDHESAIRTALGAGRWAMVRSTLQEAALLGLGAAPFAWAVASLVLHGLGASLGDDLASLGPITMGVRTALVGVALLLLTTTLLAVWPAWHVATQTAHPRAAPHAVTDAPGRRRVRRLLVVGQVAGSTLLVVLALLCARSLDRLLDQPRGFRSSGVTALRYDLDWEQPKRDIDRLAERVLASVTATPGVTAAGIVDRFPLMGGTQSTRVRLFGEANVPGDRQDVSVRSATPGYFEAMSIPFVAGGPYLDGADGAARGQVVVNVAFARRYMGTLDVVGRRVSIDWEGAEARWLEIVGVIGDVRQGVRDEAAVPEIYRPWVTAFWPLLHVAVRGDGSEGMGGRLRDRLRSDIPDHPLAQLTTLDDALAVSLRQPRGIARVLSVCAATAALLAMIGLYGLLAGEMLARRREVGIRMALGAREWRLLASLVRPGLALCLTGIATGVVVSVPAARAIESQLFGVSSGDLSVRLLSALVLLAAGLCAVLIPARRTVGTRALTALKYE